MKRTNGRSTGEFIGDSLFARGEKGRGVKELGNRYEEEAKELSRKRHKVRGVTFKKQKV